jgi:hypothetical protein
MAWPAVLKIIMSVIGGMGGKSGGEGQQKDDTLGNLMQQNSSFPIMSNDMQQQTQDDTLGNLLKYFGGR